MKKYNILILIWLFSFTVTVFGQPESRADREARAQNLAFEAISIVKESKPENMKSAISKFEEAGKLFKELDNKTMEAYCLFFLGNIYNFQGDIKKSLNYLEKALLLFREVENKEFEGGTLMLIASANDYIGEEQKAIDYFTEALNINRQSKNKISEAAILLKLSAIYSRLEQYEKSIEYSSKALILFRELENKEAEAGILKGIADDYSSLGEGELALKYYENALLLQRNLGKKIAESAILNNIGSIYSSLGETEKALKYYNEALSISRKLGNKNEEAYTLMNIGEVYFYLGKKQETFDYANKAFATLNSSGNTIEDKRGQSAALHNLAFAYSFLGDKKKALDYYEQALQIRQSIGDKSTEAATLSGIGTIYADMGNPQKAIEYYTKALPILRAVKNKNHEALIFANLAGVFMKKNLRLATLFGKKSINNHQYLRRAIQGLDTEIQKSYIRRVQIPYQALIEILLSQNRLVETFQVVEAEKNQQSFDIISNLQRRSRLLTFTASEENFSKLYEDAADKIGNIAERIEKFKRELGPREPNTSETQSLKELESQLEAANDEFLAVIKQAEVEFAEPTVENDVQPKIIELTDLQTTLRNLESQTDEKIAAIYTVFTKEKFVEIIITPNKITSVFSIIKGIELHEKAMEFADNIKTLNAKNKPKIDVTDQAKELYNIIFKPIEAELPKDTTTIMWSLDDNLRYVPMSALHDGKDYLIRRQLNNVVFTRSEAERLMRPLNPVWKVTGLANSIAKRNVKNLDVNYDFAQLVAVEEEINGIIKKPKSSEGILDGEILINQNFTKDTMLTALKKKNAVVHISSHFSIKSGDISRSFLLLGDGTSFSLSDMRKESGLFEDVDLLTLSACNTAVNEPNSEGREVDGFAELAQRLGAASVMATLWSVNECSTAEFMKLFYKNKFIGKMTKAEALRQTQLKMLDGKIKITNKYCKASKNDEDNSPLAPKSTRKFKAYKENPLKPFEHPYYWAPFVLYGNWK